MMLQLDLVVSVRHLSVFTLKSATVKDIKACFQEIQP